MRRYRSYYEALQGFSSVLDKAKQSYQTLKPVEVFTKVDNVDHAMEIADKGSTAWVKENKKFRFFFTIGEHKYRVQFLNPYSVLEFKAWALAFSSGKDWNSLSGKVLSGAGFGNVMKKVIDCILYFVEQEPDAIIRFTGVEKEGEKVEFQNQRERIYIMLAKRTHVPTYLIKNVTIKTVGGKEKKQFFVISKNPLPTSKDIVEI